MSLRYTCLQSLFTWQKQMVLAEGKNRGFVWRGLMVQSPGAAVTRVLVQRAAEESKERETKAPAQLRRFCCVCPPAGAACDLPALVSCGKK